MAQKVGNYLDRIEEECEQYRLDANRTIKDLTELAYPAELCKKDSLGSPRELFEEDKLRKGIAEKFSRINLYSEEDRKVAANCNRKLALTAFTNDTMQSEVERGEGEDFKLLNTQISKLEDMINKISSGSDEELNAVILRGLENINSKLDAVVVPSGGANEQTVTESQKPVG